MSKDSGILGIETKHNTDTKDIKPTQGFGRIIPIGLQQSFINATNNLSGLHGNLHFLAQMFVLSINKEHQTVILLAKVFKQNLFRFAIWAFHVIDKELGKITSNNPTGMLGQRQAYHITASLLERIQHGTVALKDALSEVFSQRFLLNQHFG